MCDVAREVVFGHPRYRFYFYLGPGQLITSAILCNSKEERCILTSSSCISFIWAISNGSFVCSVFTNRLFYVHV